MTQERRFAHATMIAPAPGFTARTMARIQTFERARARRRAMIGAGLLVIAAVAALLVALLWIGVFVAQVIATPSALVAVMNTSGFLADLAGTVVNALWISAVAFVLADTTQLLVYALFVCGLLLLWLRVVGGPFQWSPHTISSGESK